MEDSQHLRAVRVVDELKRLKSRVRTGRRTGRRLDLRLQIRMDWRGPTFPKRLEDGAGGGNRKEELEEEPGDEHDPPVPGHRIVQSQHQEYLENQESHKVG